VPLEEVADIVCDLITVLAGTSPALIYQGAISVGQVVVDDDFIVGDAINDAAKWHEQAAAAAVYLTPTAKESFGIGRGDSPCFFDWSVPLRKGAGTVDTLALNPLWSQIQAHGQSRIDALVAGFLAPFGHSRSPDVVEKETNTSLFLAAAKTYSETECDGFAQNLDASTGPAPTTGGQDA